ncbi:MAG: cysteine desulfurase [Bacteroidetes bacterium]|nr:cysteine desulfurase [Bacteroidota bacterium]
MKVYLDNAATTALYPEVIDKITETLTQCYGNPSSTHGFGRTAKTLVETARKQIAQYFGVTAPEIIFTSGGTETDNLVLQSAVRCMGIKHIITSKIEHHAVLHTVEALEKEFHVNVSYVPVDKYGEIHYEILESLLKNSTEKTLVSLMHINNEVGTVLDVHRVGQLCKAHHALFHSDTVQSVAHFPLNFSEIPVDFAVASAHKFHGPKGVGFAYIRKHSGLKPLLLGGEQERGLRAGTESVHNIVGMAEALRLSIQNMEEESAYIASLKNYFIHRLKESIPQVIINACCENPEKSTYTLVNVRIPLEPKKASILLFHLDLNGIACSKGSACQSGSDKGSHVLAEILDEETQLHPSLRFSFSKFNMKEELDYVVDVLKKFVES